VSWDDVGGLEDVRRTLRSAVELPRRCPAIFERAGLRPPTGFLLAGPPGTGKSLAAKALAAETGLRLITVDPASLFSKWVGESEKALRQVFKKAKQTAPCVLFFDGLEALVPAHGSEPLEPVSERLASQFFGELDELVELGDVLILGATNRPDRVDPALLRPGRFGFTVRFTLPDAAAREQILAVHLRRAPLADEVDLARLAAGLEGASGAEIAGVCQRALLDEAERFVAERGDGADADDFRLTQGALTRAAADLNRR
jgi:transitional endoplasmic reticulum ATPase